MTKQKQKLDRELKRLQKFYQYTTLWMKLMSLICILKKSLNGKFYLIYFTKMKNKKYGIDMIWKKKKVYR